MVVIISEDSRCAFLIGKEWNAYNLEGIIPDNIALRRIEFNSALHISYSIISIARQIVLKSPDVSSFEHLAFMACQEEVIEETIKDVEFYILKCSLKSESEINSYLAKYEELTEQDSLNYSSSDNLSYFESLIGKTSRMSDWINNKLKVSMISGNSSIVQFDALNRESMKKNPFDIASSFSDQSSLNRQTISLEEVIDSTFVNSLLELGTRKKTIIMQIDDKPESCQCGICPMI